MVTAKKASTPKPVAAAPAVAKPVAARKPPVKKAVAGPDTVNAAPAAPAKATAVAKSKAVNPAAGGNKPTLSAEQRNNYVEVAAFYIAERRGFVPGNPADDWCAAEREVDRLIATGHFN